YADYTSIATPVALGQSINLIINSNNPGYYYDYHGVWIDWNQNGDFSDDQPIPVYAGFGYSQRTITVPFEALPGTTRMRVRTTYNTPLPCGIDQYGEVEDYTININDTILNDLGVPEINYPVSGMVLSAEEHVRVNIKNCGYLSQSGFPVVLVINGDTVASEIFTSTLYPTEITEFTFTQPYDFSLPGNYNISVFTLLPGDENQLNDMVSSSITLTAPNPGEIGMSRYDLQSNAASMNRLYLFDDGTLGATWTMGFQDPGFPDRGTGYNFFNGSYWNPVPSARVEDIRTGWPSYAPWGSNGEIIVSHTSSTDGLKISRALREQVYGNISTLPALRKPRYNYGPGW
ncbi:MAG: GEVED domain-containing protein, partial [Bacteroidetes bacterium]|nr:GEVED domain-containing protein [Bacteroidota bacterium]